MEVFRELLRLRPLATVSALVYDATRVSFEDGETWLGLAWGARGNCFVQSCGGLSSDGLFCCNTGSGRLLWSR